MLAEAVVLAHFLFVVFVAGGGLLVLRWPSLAWLHLPAVAWGAAVAIWQLPCPLTALEFAADPSRPERGFLARLLLPVLYPELQNPGVLSRGLGIALGAGVLFVNAVLYAFLPRALRHRRRRRAELAAPAP